MSDTRKMFEKRMGELRAEIAAKLAAVAPQRARRDALLGKQMALAAEIEALSTEINAVSVAAEKRELTAVATALEAIRK